MTVHAPTCEAAEVAAKAALIVGSDEGAAFLERHRLTGLLSTASESYPAGAWPVQTAGAA